MWNRIKQAYTDWWNAEDDPDSGEPSGVEWFNTSILFMFILAGLVWWIV